MRHFGETLSRIRRQRGFPSARSFYKGRDGRRTLGLSYPNYLNLERGKSLPQISRVERILSALGLEEHAAEARELVRAYFDDLGVSPKLLQLAGAAAPPEEAKASLAEEAAGLAIQRRRYQLAMGCWQVLARDSTAHALFRVLLATDGWLSVEHLARMTKLPASVAERALAALESVDLAEVSQGRARSPHVGRVIESLPNIPATAAVKAALRRDLDKRVAESAPAGIYDNSLRLTKPALGRYLRQLEQAVALASFYEEPEPKPESAVFLVHARVHKLFE
ncbi:MAG: hypothetical protein HY925_03850 [Elusimicrobia bacterium]|nr:hypothetical protein [Elusimicrobiota bacterium]